jgi:hypothetical protein
VGENVGAEISNPFLVTANMRKRQPQGLNRLSVAAIKYLEAPGWHADGGSLYLEIDSNGRKRWAMRLTVNGRRRDFGLGPLHKVSLAEAREVAASYRAKAYRGLDPVADKKTGAATPAIPTFKDAAEQVHRQRAQAWSNGKHVDQWINTLRDYAFPVIGDIPVSLGKSAKANISQIRVVDTRRLEEKIGFLDKEMFETVRKAARAML